MLVSLTLCVTQALLAAATLAKTRYNLIDNVWFFSTTNSSLSTDWTRVSLPHTWNGLDTQSGGHYRRNASWYRTLLLLADVDLEASRLVLDVGAANAVADVFVNEIFVGQHRGGFSRFRMDFTEQAKTVANNWKLCSLTLKVDNSASISDVLPLKSDFPMFGGIFRDIGYWLIKKHVPVLDPFDSGSSGVQLQQTNIISQTHPIRATYQTTVRVTCFGNLSDTAFSVNIRVFDGSQNVVNSTHTYSLHSSCLLTSSFMIPFSISNPHVWHGRVDPFLYKATIEIVHQSRIVDSYTTKIGARTYYIHPERGFILNGRPYSLHGVNLHQDWDKLGWAISAKHTLENFRAMVDLNMTALRCSNYQHSDYTYTLADEFGFVVWAEIPNLKVVPVNPAAYLNAGSQLRELIRQAGNHASILFWSIGHELDVMRSNPLPLLWMLQKVAKSEDPYRMTTMSITSTTALTNPIASITDTIAITAYHGWQGTKTSNQTGPFLDIHHSQNPFLKFGICEYGAGASPFLHNDTPTRLDHTEEYQSLVHENIFPQLFGANQRPYLWWKALSSFADFAATSTTAADGSNMRTPITAPTTVKAERDLGLLTSNRNIRKDSFFYYKAQWNSGDPMVYITSSRFKYRKQVVDVKVYSTGVESLSLTVNGNVVVLQEEGSFRKLRKGSNDDKIHIWESVRLREGSNSVLATATSLLDGSSVVSNLVVWYHIPDLVVMDENN